MDSIRVLLSILLASLRSENRKVLDIIALVLVPCLAWQNHVESQAYNPLLLHIEASG